MNLGRAVDWSARSSAPVRTYVALALLAAAAAVHAADAPVRGDAAKGKQLAAQVCAPCHNADGNSVISTNPKLSGQGADYIVKQLTDLAKPAGDKTGRENAIMSGIASTLEPADRANVAAWFAAQKSDWTNPSGAKDLEMGQRLYRAGLPEKAVPACAGCHGPTGAGLPALYPRIGGQYAEYLEAQLHAFREGTRRNNEPMYHIAFRLSDPEIKALADYISVLHAR